MGIRNSSLLARNRIGRGTARRQAMMSKVDRWLATTTYETSESTYSLPFTSRSVPDATSQTRDHQRITRSIRGEVSLNAAINITLTAPTTVAATPEAQVAIDLTTISAQRIAARLVLA